ncbi:MAG TPA: hypothetical protein DCQ50_14665 [Chryseobacterium sp.]|nr:hypothetical protein [Chryseobacterium gambrini]HAO08189.1 hypothetical protein [Chryseobacterium sp.]
MITRKQRLDYRNAKVKEYFTALEKKHPQWKLQALLEDTAREFPPLATGTISAIIKGTGKYAQ